MTAEDGRPDTMCPCRFWNCTHAKQMGWCEADGEQAKRPVVRLATEELQLEAKHWRNHAHYAQRPWAIERVAEIDAELVRRQPK